MSSPEPAGRQDAMEGQAGSSEPNRDGAPPDQRDFYARLEVQLAEIKRMIEERNIRAARLVRPALSRSVRDRSATG
jgi:hypothetical protein